MHPTSWTGGSRKGDLKSLIESVIAHLPLARPSRTQLLSGNQSLLVFLLR
jgi:hypothetical protein